MHLILEQPLLKSCMYLINLSDFFDMSIFFQKDGTFKKQLTPVYAAWMEIIFLVLLKLY